MISKVANKLKNYNWLLILLFLGGIFLAMFCLALLLVFFLTFFGVSQFSWKNVLICSSVLTVFMIFVFSVMNVIARDDEMLNDEENPTWKK